MNRFRWFIFVPVCWPVIAFLAFGYLFIITVRVLWSLFITIVEGLWHHPMWALALMSFIFGVSLTAQKG